jgi:peptidyl-dipeptidase Dcp
MVAGMTSPNPLLTKSDLPYHLPRFADITSAHYEEAIMSGMARQRTEIDAIAADPATPTFDNTLVAIERTGGELRFAAGVFYLNQGADTTPELDAIDERIAPLLAAHNDAIFLDARLFARVNALYENRDALGLDAPEAWLLERYHTEFVRAGAHLGTAEQDELRAINAELASLTTEFGNRVRAATKAAIVDIHDEALLDGLSDDAIAAAKAAAEGRDAPYALSFILPTAQPALASLTNRDLRERIYRASIGRGTSGGDTDTTALIPQIVALRARRAALFGYPNHAAYVIADNTARTVDAVADMLGKLAPAAAANAAAEAAELQAVIDADGGGFTLAAWDWAYYTERVRAAHYDIDENALRPYFELNRVLVDGVFFAATKLYGVTFAERPDLVGYNADVQIFEVFEADGTPLGLIVADYIKRPSKSGGAWMDSLLTPNDVEGTLPVVTQNMNIDKAPAGQPTLMSLDEVRTMFHEFGHALHGLFGKARWPLFAGTNSPRDFVEYPSQVNELWKLWPDVLANYATHVETGEPLPQDVVDRLNASEIFNEGFATSEYLAAALLDLAWHSLAPGEVVTDVLEFEAEALAKAGLANEAVPPRYRSGYFAHVFAGGYSAGYYGYIWSEVLDADTVDWFRENGGLTRENGDAFRYGLLGAVGSADPMTVFREFRGREPRIEPLLKRRGLLTE